MSECLAAPLGHLYITSNTTLVTLNSSSSRGKTALAWTCRWCHGITFIDFEEPGCNPQQLTVLGPQHHWCGPILQICPLQHPQDPNSTQLLVQVLVIPRLDYCNLLLAWHPASVTKPLQCIQNAAECLVFILPKFSHVTPILCNENDSNDALHIDGSGSPIRLDRDSALTGKHHGGGVCIYVNKNWFSSVVVREELCNSEIELLVISLCPFHLPQGFPQIFIILVYIHPKAKASVAAEHVKNTMNRLESVSPDGPKFFMGDLNHCSLDKSRKGFDQYIGCTTRFGKTLDKCYGSIPNAYRAVPLPPSRLCRP